MKKIFIAIILPLVLAGIAACSDEQQTIWDDYTDWRDLNDQWLTDMKARKDDAGKPYYEVLIPAWNPSVYVLIHYFNDRSETAGNLVPLYTSVVDVRYIGYDCEDEPFDSSTLVNTYGKLGIQRFAVNATIQGWGIAMMDMHVGDTAEVIVPYDVAYGTSSTTTIKPYSNLRFNISLDDIYKYEAAAN